MSVAPEDQQAGAGVGRQRQQGLGGVAGIRPQLQMRLDAVPPEEFGDAGAGVLRRRTAVGLGVSPGGASGPPSGLPCGASRRQDQKRKRVFVCCRIRRMARA